MSYHYSKYAPNVSRNEALRRLAETREERDGLKRVIEEYRDNAIPALTAERDAAQAAQRATETALVRSDEALVFHRRVRERHRQSLLYRLAVRWADWRFPNFPTTE